MVDAPEMREIATTVDGRDITRGYVSPMLLLGPQDRVLQLRGGGDYALYREVLKDDQVAACFQQRRLAVVSRDWEVQAGGEGRRDKAAADFLREQIEHISFDAVTDKLLYGVFYGYAVAECIWMRDGRQVVLDALRVRDRRRFGFDGLGRLRLLTTASPNPGELMPERKFVAFQTGADHDDEPYGLGLAHWLYWPTFFKRNGLKFWLIFLDKFGQPTSKGTYPPGATAEERRKLLDALEAIHTDSGVIVPEGMAIELIEAARSGTVDYTALYDRMDRAIAKVVLGQVAATEGTPGRLGNDALQQQVRADIVKADADLISHTFNMTVARWLTEWNFPGAAQPRVWRKLEEPDDLNATSERDSRIVQMGFRPALRYIHDTYGGEWVEAPAAGAAGLAYAEGGAEPSDTAGRQGLRLDQEMTPALGEMIDRLRRLVEEAASLEALRDGLLEVYPRLDAEAFAQVMGRALVAAELAGRYDILEQAGGG